jgi:2-iminobutanoate/2-iminopropanoate deaminase
MTPQSIPVHEVPASNDTYSQAVRLGDLIYVSGQLGVRSGGGIASGFSEQTRQAIENVATVLRRRYRIFRGSPK